MTTTIAVALGGALGSVARHLVNLSMARSVPHLALPYATFVETVVGCFAIGLLAGLTAGQRLQLAEASRAFVFIGLLGGFTTFSTFGLDTLALLQSDLRALAMLNVVGQVVIGLLAVYTGFRLAEV